MLYVLCRIGRDAYAIPSDIVVRILPFVALKVLPGAPIGLAGLLNYQGSSVPVIDLPLVLTGEPARAVLSTRIILCSSDESSSKLVGVILEEVSRTAQLEEKDFHTPGATGAPCLREVNSTPEGLIQRIDIPGIFPPGLIASLDLSVV
ncbi:chemotaxis protein CheW [soil metagenome]